jgi:hypothetical protein
MQVKNLSAVYIRADAWEGKSGMVLEYPWQSPRALLKLPRLKLCIWLKAWEDCRRCVHATRLLHDICIASLVNDAQHTTQYTNLGQHDVRGDIFLTTMMGIPIGLSGDVCQSQHVHLLVKYCSVCNIPFASLQTGCLKLFFQTLIVPSCGRHLVCLFVWR